MEMKRWVNSNVEAAKMFFEKLVDLVWPFFAASMWFCAFLCPLIAISMILSFCGVNKNSDAQHFDVSNICALILFFSLPYFYVYKLRKQTNSTSYKFFFMCTFAYALALFQISEYQYYVEHCQAGVTKVRAVDAETKEAVPYSVSSPSSKWGRDFSKGRGVSYTIREGADLWMGLLWMGCEPVSSTVNADGYESKTIILKPNQIDTVTVELQRVKPAQGESAVGGQN